MRKFLEMAVTRLERKARRNKTKAKERTLAIKRNIRRNFVASPYKGESGVVLEDDVLTVSQNLTSAAKAPSKKKGAPKTEATEASATATAKAPAAKAKAGDKLNKIEGIGPKIASVLNEAGIDSFATLATKTSEEIAAILDSAEGNFKAHDPGTWPKQAEMAAAGNWDELKKWQDELDGGK
ncbi:MAG: putative flap endonuclease-1-like 5' DNA nuclease [Bacteroidia bacterium]